MKYKDSPNIRKKEEFEEFLKAIKKGNLPHWLVIAQALGVNKDTITEWKKRPQARRAIAEGISHSVKKMEETGKNDWRMWQAKLKMLGVDFENKEEVIEDDNGFMENVIIFKPSKNSE